MLLEAFDEEYIQALRDATDMINVSIPTIMDYLVNLYGQITPEQFWELKKEMEELIYDPMLPIDILFNKIEFFADLADFASKFFSNNEKIWSGFNSPFRMFESSLSNIMRVLSLNVAG